MPFLLLPVLLAVLLLQPAPASGAIAEDCVSFQNGTSLPAIGDIEALAGLLQFQSCYGTNKSSLPLSFIRELFTEARADPLLHMKDPQVFCLDRAYLLAERIFQAGYRARLVHIKRSPTLIGLVTMGEGQPTRYMDYQGEHWVVAVQPERGPPLILDPQFMDQPMPYSAYFIATTGQKCGKQRPANAWQCNYEENEIKSFRLPPLETTSVEYAGLSLKGCEWPFAAAVAKRLDGINHWTFNLSTKLPPDISSLAGESEMRRQLILKAYETRRNEIEKALAEKSTFLSSLSQKGCPAGLSEAWCRESIPGIKAEIAAAQASLRQYEAVLSLVKKNLESLGPGQGAPR